MFQTTNTPPKIVPQVHVFVHDHAKIATLMNHINTQISEPKIVNLHLFCDEAQTMLGIKDAVTLSRLMSSHNGFTVHDTQGESEVRNAMKYCHEITRVMSTCNNVDAIIIDDSQVSMDGVFSNTPIARVTYTSALHREVVKEHSEGEGS